MCSRQLSVVLFPRAICSWRSAQYLRCPFAFPVLFVPVQSSFKTSLSLSFEASAVLVIKRCSGSMSYMTSSPRVGVDCLTGVIVIAASLLSFLSLLILAFCVSVCHHTKEAYEIFGLIIPVKSHFDRNGLGPHFFLITLDVYIRVDLHVFST